MGLLETFFFFCLERQLSITTSNEYICLINTVPYPQISESEVRRRILEQRCSTTYQQDSGIVESVNVHCFFGKARNAAG